MPIIKLQFIVDFNVVCFTLCDSISWCREHWIWSRNLPAANLYVWMEMSICYWWCARGSGISTWASKVSSYLSLNKCRSSVLMVNHLIPSSGVANAQKIYCFLCIWNNTPSNLMYVKTIYIFTMPIEYSCLLYIHCI